MRMAILPDLVSCGAQPPVVQGGCIRVLAPWALSLALRLAVSQPLGQRDDRNARLMSSTWAAWCAGSEGDGARNESGDRELQNPAARGSAKAGFRSPGAAKYARQSPITEANRCDSTSQRTPARQPGVTRRWRIPRPGAVIRVNVVTSPQRHVTEGKPPQSAPHRARCGCCHPPAPGRRCPVAPVIVIGVGMLRRAFLILRVRVPP